MVITILVTIQIIALFVIILRSSGSSESLIIYFLLLAVQTSPVANSFSQFLYSII